MKLTNHVPNRKTQATLPLWLSLSNLQCQYDTNPPLFKLKFTAPGCLISFFFPYHCICPNSGKHAYRHSHHLARTS